MAFGHWLIGLKKAQEKKERKQIPDKIGLYLFFSIVGLIFLGFGLVAALILGKILKYFGNKILRRNDSKPYFVVSAVIVSYNIYRSFYPGESFYLGQFKKITGLKNANNIEVVYGTAGYPWVHGDYCSAALLKTSKDNFQQLIDSLRIDSTRKKESVGFGCAELSELIQKTGIKRDVLFEAGGQKGNDSYFIQFLPDEKMVAVFCNT